MLVRKLVLFLSSGEGETPTVLGPLERPNLNHCIFQSIILTRNMAVWDISVIISSSARSLTWLICAISTIC
jgi:hypothetical protein